MTHHDILSKFEDGTLTWGDLLEITGMAPHELYDLLFGGEE